MTPHYSCNVPEPLCLNKTPTFSPAFKLFLLVSFFSGFQDFCCVFDFSIHLFYIETIGPFWVPHCRSRITQTPGNLIMNDVVQLHPNNVFPTNSRILIGQFAIIPYTLNWLSLNLNIQHQHLLYRGSNPHRRLIMCSEW